jgi:hypothetical protein
MQNCDVYFSPPRISARMSLQHWPRTEQHGRSIIECRFSRPLSIGLLFSGLCRGRLDCKVYLQAPKKIAAWLLKRQLPSNPDDRGTTRKTITLTWSFISPYTPHFGGLWEAGVTSVKSLLLKAVGPQTLTFEEMTTYLAQVEFETLNPSFF